MTALTEFLLARIGEDEVTARAAFIERAAWAAEEDVQRLEWWVCGEFGGLAGTGYVGNSDSRSIAEHIARHDPARVLAECEAKRQIVTVADWRGPSETLWDRLLGPAADTAFRAGINFVLRQLALPYADHPDYRDEWRP